MVSYSASIVTVALSLAMSQIGLFSIKEWPDLEICMVPTVRGRQGKSGSFKKSGKVMESQVKQRGSGKVRKFFKVPECNRVL